MIIATTRPPHAPRFDYWLCGWRVQSEISLPELLPWTGTESRPPDVTIRIGEIPHSTAAAVLDTPGVRVLATGDCLLSIPDVAAYAIDSAGREVVVQPLREPLPHTAPGYLLTTVFGIICHARRLLPLHASCVLIDGRAIAFAGPSGSGKSTMAAALVKRGCVLVSDDVAAIDTSNPERPIVQPAFPRLKLWREALTSLDVPAEGLERGRTGVDRFRLPTSSFDGHPAALAAIYVFRWTDDPAAHRVERLNGVRAVQALRQVVYRDRVGEAIAGHGALLASVGRLSAQVPTYSWGRGVSLDRLSASVDDLLARHAGP